VADLTGRILQGRYRVEELVGRGGMAEVYKAWDTWRNYHVAIKVMREDLAEDLEFVRRFRREATALAGLAHENIVRFYSFGREDLLAFIVMDYVEGTTLRSEIARAEGPLPLKRVLSVAKQVCAALHYAHMEGMIHRDVKPGNIIIQPDGQVLLSDFGIAKAADAATATTVMPGTPAYMSPEQCRSEPLDVRTDIYSLGVVVYEMLTGRRPFVGKAAPETVTGGTRERVRWEQMHADPPPLRRYHPALSREVEAVVLRALAKERDGRWPTALAFWRALKEALGVEGPGAVAELVPELEVAAPAVEPVPSPMPVLQSPSPVSPTRQRMPGWIWVLGALAVLLLCSGGLLLLWGVGQQGWGHLSLLLQTLTPTPAATPAPITSTKMPHPTRTSTKTPHPTRTPTETPRSPATSARAPAAVPVLTFPEQGRTYQSPITFQWQGRLGTGQTYRVRVWHPKSGSSIQSSSLSTSSWTASLPGDKFGEWRWYVSVLQGGSVAVTSAEGMFWFNPFPGGGGERGPGSDYP
jgi:serine/threonine protein kinase